MAHVSDSDAVAEGSNGDEAALQEHLVLDSAVKASASELEVEVEVEPELELELKKKRLLESVLLPKDASFEVIDDTALLDTLPASASVGRQQRRRAARARRVNKNSTTAPNPNPNAPVGTIRKYSRKDIEALRFLNVSQQRKFWKAIYGGLHSAVANEYNTLAATRLPNNKPILSSVRCENMDSELQLMENSENVSHLVDTSCSHSLLGDDGCSNLEECSEDDNSEDDYASIQRPAFLVEGEPNFDSGPPEDGWEYLRRVRWEADQIPKVKVAKLDRSKLNKEQSAYMPKIPDIAKCPENLLPLKQWEDVFLAEFSALRALLLQNVSCHEDSNGNSLQGVLVCNGKGSDQPRVEDPVSETSTKTPTHPMLSAILRMDCVARVSMLLKRISLLEAAKTVTRNDCVWLFALCATVDTPLDADTCAALRTLLRKCATIRAGKAELDDEVVMLNILATISGRYFGQSDN